MIYHLYKTLNAVERYFLPSPPAVSWLLRITIFPLSEADNFLQFRDYAFIAHQVQVVVPLGDTVKEFVIFKDFQTLCRFDLPLLLCQVEDPDFHIIDVPDIRHGVSENCILLFQRVFLYFKVSHFNGIG